MLRIYAFYSARNFWKSISTLEAVIARLAARRNEPKYIDRLKKIVDLMEVSSIQKNNKESIRYDI